MTTRKKVTAIPMDDGNPKCANCMHFLIEKNEQVGICRRYPSQVVVINDDVQMAVRIESPDWLCGEHKRLPQ